jgi:teichuronic acid biosynthesis glycosyltransferase TuaG
MKKVSIITPCFNAEKFIKETYDCLKSQTYTNWEWVITDDCSTDDSVQIIENLIIEDTRVKLVKNTINSGAAKTRNVSLDNATGEYCAFLDVDDLWEREKLQKQIEFMEQKSCEFSYHDYWTVDAEGNILKEQILDPKYTATDLLRFNPFATSSIMISTPLLSSNNIRFKEHLRRRQDYLFWYDAMIASKQALGIQQKLSKYRIFGDESLSADKKKMALIQWGLYRNEFNFGFIKSAYYFVHYAIHGLKKYFL